MIQVRKVLVGLAVVALPLIAGCSSSSTTTTPTPPPNAFVYYSTDDGTTLGNPALGVIAWPVTAASTIGSTLANSAANGLGSTKNLAVDSAGRLFVLNGGFTPNTVTVFTPPLSSTSTPTITLTLPAAITSPFPIALDASGNLWIGDDGTDTIYEFNGPFTGSATLAANITMVSPSSPESFAFDSTGNLWVALDAATNSVAEFVKGAAFTNATVATVFLDGVTDADSVAFDKNGNLYAGGDPPGRIHPLGTKGGHTSHPGLRLNPNVVEADGIGFWPPANQVNGGLPTIVNNTGLAAGFFSFQLAFDSLGNLYDADCGTTGKLYVFPTATQAWSATLAPVVYSDTNIATTKCVAGVAIH